MTDTIIVLQNEREEAGTMILKEKETYNDRRLTDTGKKAVLRNMEDMRSRQKILN